MKTKLLLLHNLIINDKKYSQPVNHSKCHNLKYCNIYIYKEKSELLKIKR